jgi:metallo-beta-lactamase family protein
VLETLRTLPYRRAQEIAPGVTLTFLDAGHILGSAIVVLDVAEPGARRRLVFCGDLGHSPAPLLRDPEHPGEADVLLLESTYGDRDHRPQAETLEQFRRLILDAQSRGAKVLVPSFAVGRTQELVYHLGELRRAGVLEMPVYVDSPLAEATTQIYRRHRELYDQEARELLENGDAPLGFDTLRFCHTPEESMALNDLAGPAVIIAASACARAGASCTTSSTTPGGARPASSWSASRPSARPAARWSTGARTITLMGERLEVNASVHTLGGFSAHAGQTELLPWTGRFPRGAADAAAHLPGARRAVAAAGARREAGASACRWRRSCRWGGSRSRSSVWCFEQRARCGDHVPAPARETACLSGQRQVEPATTTKPGPTCRCPLSRWAG